jgi:hypothetical protein
MAQPPIPSYFLTKVMEGFEDGFNISTLPNRWKSSVLWDTALCNLLKINTLTTLPLAPLNNLVHINKRQKTN